MISNVIRYINKLFIKYTGIHNCNIDNNYYECKPNYIFTGKIGKGKCSTRYNVYNICKCTICSKIIYKHKHEANITYGKLKSRYDVNF